MYKFKYSSKLREKYNFITLFIALVLIDIGILIVVDFLLFFPIFYIIGLLHELITGIVECPDRVLYSAWISILVIELIIIIIVEIKRRFTYCQIREKGIYIYNNNFAKFGCGSIFKRNATIRYSKIENCYIAIADFVPKNYSWMSLFKRIHRRILKSEQYDYIPAIADGDFENECIILELKNGKAVVMPIENCEQFLKDYTERINRIK